MIIDLLKENKNDKMAEFQFKLTPGVDRNKFLGIKVPVLRSIAKKYSYEEIKNEVGHYYFEENMLYGIAISNIKDYDTCINELENFMPYIDNWAVCDTIKPLIFNKHKDKLIIKITEWLKSEHLYTKRLAVGFLMKYFLDDDYKKEYINLVIMDTDDYYLEMMIAWYFATLLSKHFDDGIEYLKNNKLSVSIHNKVIRKCIESYRISDSNKNMLRSLKR